MALYASGELRKLLRSFIPEIREYPTEIIPGIINGLVEKKMDESITSIRDFIGEDDFEIMEAAIFFANSGLVNEAIQVLESGCMKGVDTDRQNSSHYTAGILVFENRE